MNAVTQSTRTLIAALAFGALLGCGAESPPSARRVTVAPADVEAESPATPATAATPAATAEYATRGVDLALRKRAGAERADMTEESVAPARAPVMRLLGEAKVERDAAAPAVALAQIRAPSELLDRERYQHFDDNPLKRVAEFPVSTFSIDVDTGSYANMRRFLASGRLPPQDAVRTEELLNYFDYAYPQPEPGGAPFAVTTELARTPWNPDTLLLHIGIKGREVAAAALPPANLVFLVDVSGSMSSADKLPLLKSALGMLVRRLRAEDRISLVVYAGGTGVVLQPTPGDHQAEIETAIARLGAGGRTNGAAGIRLAYRLATQAFVRGGINRVLLATDGDFNVGTVSFDALVDLVEREREGGVSLTTLGFGTGNYNDHLLERLADAGNGSYLYIDSLQEADKALVEELGSTLFTIARDVKVQIEFNPAEVAEYRLIGYENRALAREDFANDRVDAGDIGAGHTVTALYEIALAGSRGIRTEPLRYQRPTPAAPHDGELAWLRLRYKGPEGGPSRLIERPLAAHATAGATTDRFRFAAAVAAFGQILRGGRYTGGFDIDRVLALARGARGADPHGRRGEFVRLVELARSLAPPVAAHPMREDRAAGAG